MATRVHGACEHCRHWQPDAEEMTQTEQVAATLAGLGGQLYEARMRRDISQRTVAQEAGVSFSTVSRLERGLSLGDVGVVVKLLAWVLAQKPGDAS